MNEAVLCLVGLMVFGAGAFIGVVALVLGVTVFNQWPTVKRLWDHRKLKARQARRAWLESELEKERVWSEIQPLFWDEVEETSFS